MFWIIYAIMGIFLWAGVGWYGDKLEKAGKPSILRTFLIIFFYFVVIPILIAMANGEVEFNGW